MSKKSRPFGRAMSAVLIRLNVVTIIIASIVIGLSASDGVSANIFNIASAASSSPVVNSNSDSSNSGNALLAANQGAGNPSQQLLTTGETSNSSDPIIVNGEPFQYFQTTGHSLSGPVWRYYQHTGGAARHGAPLTELVMVNGLYLQFCQNTVFQFDPRYVGTSDEVKMMLLGAMVAGANNFPPVQPFVNTADRWFFPQTGHSLSSGFLNFWLNNGDQASLGLPVSEEMPGTDTQGQAVTVQYFQYVRLEYNSKSDPSVAITLTPLGLQKANELLQPTTLTPVAMNVLTASRVARIPSLMFHYVRLVDPKKDALGYGLSVTPDNFVKYLDWLQANGFHTVTVAQIYDYLRYGITLPDKPINLRFDDGYSDQWFAYQELHRRGMTATFFVITRHLELTPQQWQQIDQDGFEVAAHTRTHPDLKGSSNLAAEITGSKTDLEAMLGHPVRTFAYPYGSYGPTILKVVKASGFEVAVSTDGGANWSLDKEFVEPTIEVTGRDDLNTFINKAKLNLPDLTVSSSSSQSSSSPTPKPVVKGNAGSTKSATTTPKSGGGRPNPTPSPAKTTKK